jgi:hypothetical protein
MEQDDSRLAKDESEVVDVGSRRARLQQQAAGIKVTVSIVARQ